MRFSSADFPEPVLPMIASVSPASTRNEMSVRTAFSAPANEKEALRSSSDAGRGSDVTGSAATTTDESVCNTCAMRTAHTDARGAMLSTKVPIITAMRIWIR